MGLGERRAPPFLFYTRKQKERKMLLIDSKVISLLKETLSSIRAASDERSGWQAIISLYEKAIEKAENNKYFSVKDATRMYLEFSSHYTADVLKLMGETDRETEQYFRGLLASYLEGRVGVERLETNIKDLARHTDIYENLLNYLLAGERFTETTPLEVSGFTAEQLSDQTILTPLGAFSYLVYLREEPAEALADLKAQLPHRKVSAEKEGEEYKSV